MRSFPTFLFGGLLLAIGWRERRNWEGGEWVPGKWSVIKRPQQNLYWSEFFLDVLSSLPRCLFVISFKSLIHESVPRPVPLYLQYYIFYLSISIYLVNFSVSYLHHLSYALYSFLKYSNERGSIIQGHVSGFDGRGPGGRHCISQRHDGRDY